MLKPGDPELSKQAAPIIAAIIDAIPDSTAHIHAFAYAGTLPPSLQININKIAESNPEQDLCIYIQRIAK